MLQKKQKLQNRKQNFLNVRQTVAEEHVLCTEQANATGTLVEGRKRLGGFSIGADVEGLDFLAPVENRLGGFFELGRNGHGDFAEVNFAGRTGNRDIITTFYGVAVVIINPRCTNQCPNQP